MATEISIVRTQASTLGGNQDITSADITDFSAAIVFVFGATVAGTQAAHARMCIGLCIEDQLGATGIAKAACISTNSRDADTDTTENRSRCANWNGTTPAAFIVVMSPTAPTTTVVAAANAIDRTTSGVANGVRINWTTTPDAAYEMVVILFGGLAGQDLQLSQTTTTWGFSLDAGFTITGGTFGTGDGTVNNGSRLDFGMVSNYSSIIQSCFASRWPFGSAGTTDADGIVNSAKASQRMADNGTLTTGMVVTGVTATQMTATDPEGVMLAMAFSDASTWGVALESLPAATGVASFTGLGFTPGYAFGLCTLLNATDTQTDGPTASTEGLFAFDLQGTTYAGCHRADEGVVLGTSDTSTLFDTKALLLLDDTGTIANSATSPAGVGSGFSLNFGTAGAGRMIVFGLQLPTVIKVFTETVSIADGIVSVLARTAVTSETVSIADQGLLFEQDASMAGPDEPRRGLIVSGGVARGDIATGGAEAGLVVSSPG